MFTSKPRRNATWFCFPLPIKPINIQLPRSIMASFRSDRSTPSAPKDINVTVDQYSSPAVALSSTGSEHKTHETSSCGNEHTHLVMPSSPPPYTPSVSKLFNAHRRDCTHAGYLGGAQPFGRALLAGPSLNPMKVPRGDLSASAGSVAHTRAFPTPDQRSTRRSGRALSSHSRGNFSHATQDNCMLAGTPELHHENSSMSVAVAPGFIREPSITTPLHERNASDRLLSSSETSTRKLSPTGIAPQESLGKSEAPWISTMFGTANRLVKSLRLTIQAVSSTLKHSCSKCRTNRGSIHCARYNTRGRPATSSHEPKLEMPSTPKLHMPINSSVMIEREGTFLSGTSVLPICIASVGVEVR